jgi:hypothetical protein
MGVKSLAGTSSPLISFGELIDFRGYIFPGVADFTEAEFLAVVIFDNATFCGPAWFRHLCSNRIADFKWTTFFEQPFFLKATFVQSGDFVNTSFKKGVDFSAISAQSVFILEGAYFGRLPNLRQAHFTEPPSLDHIVLADDVEPGGFWRSIFRRCPTNTPERYRELKRLAVQGHNHDLECKFFKGEQRARRSAFDSPWPWKLNCARFWWSLCYDALSDFGVSTARPFLLWIASIPAFAYVLSRSANPRLCPQSRKI